MEIAFIYHKYTSNVRKSPAISCRPKYVKNLSPTSAAHMRQWIVSA